MYIPNLKLFKFSRLVVVCIAMTVIGLTYNTAAASNVKPTYKDYAALPSLKSVSVSPSGRMIAFVHSIDDKKIVKIFDLEKREIVAAFDAGEILPKLVYFVDNDRVLIRVEDEGRRLIGFKGVHDISNAFVYSIKQNKLRQLLTPGDVIYAGQTAIGSIVGISDDGNYAYMPAWTPKHRGSRHIRYSLVKASLGWKRKSPKLYVEGGINTINYFMNGDAAIAIERYAEDSHTYTVEVPDGKKWRVIYTNTDDMRPFNIHGVTPDKKHLVLLATDESTRHISCYTMRLSDGEISGKIFTSNTKDIARVVTDKNRVIYGVEYDGFSPTYAFFDEQVAKKVSDIQNMFPEQSVTISDHSPDWKHIVAHVSGSHYSGNHFLVSDGKKAIGIAEQYALFKGANIHPILKTAYRAQDGLVIPALVTVPYSQQTTLANLPAVLLPHGGPESHDSVRFDWLAQSLANEGYAVIQPQFRGSRGFGIDHWLAGRGEWGKKMQSDLMDGLDSLIKDGVIDKNRICIAGWSYGGYAALAGGAFDSERFRCVVSVNGVSDLNRMLKVEERTHWDSFDYYAYWKEVVTKGVLDEDALNAISPVKNAANFSAPVLLIYGDEDEIVLPEQSKRMYKALKKAGKDVEIVKIKDEGHSFSTEENREKAIGTMIDFINTHLKQ